MRLVRWKMARISIVTAMLAASMITSTRALATPLTSTASTSAENAREKFEVSPVGDGAVLGVTGGFALLSQLIIETGELRPQDPVDASNLLGIDHAIATAEEIEGSGRTLSNVTIAIAFAYVLFDVGRAALGESGEWWGTYLALYAETTVFNIALANLAKIAFRRPRPIAYFELRQTGMVSPDTNTALSFYSGHTATMAGLAATASYLAFTRSDNAWEGSVTLGVGAVLTSYVAVQRIRARAHFPTDVIAGALVGAGVGVLVPHLHRADDDLAFRIGAAFDGSGPGIAVTGRF